jgi:hypothetical protein
MLDKPLHIQRLFTALSEWKNNPESFSQEADSLGQMPRNSDELNQSKSQNARG